MKTVEPKNARMFDADGLVVKWYMKWMRTSNHKNLTPTSCQVLRGAFGGIIAWAFTTYYKPFKDGARVSIAACFMMLATILPLIYAEVFWLEGWVEWAYIPINLYVVWAYLSIDKWLQEDFSDKYLGADLTRAGFLLIMAPVTLPIHACVSLIRRMQRMDWNTLSVSLAVLAAFWGIATIAAALMIGAVVYPQHALNGVITLSAMTLLFFGLVYAIKAIPEEKLEAALACRKATIYKDGQPVHVEDLYQKM